MTGASQPPSVRQNILPSSEIIWLKAMGRKSANCRKATGRFPARASPQLIPTIEASASGEFLTLPGYSVVNPRVTPKTSPFGSSISSPKSTTRLSAAMRAPRASLKDSIMVIDSPLSRGSAVPEYSVSRAG